MPKQLLQQGTRRMQVPNRTMLTFGKFMSSLSSLLLVSTKMSIKSLITNTACTDNVFEWKIVSSSIRLGPLIQIIFLIFPSESLSQFVPPQSEMDFQAA
jgi:hypothetical protein